METEFLEVEFRRGDASKAPQVILMCSVRENYSLRDAGLFLQPFRGVHVSPVVSKPFQIQQ